MVDQVWVGTGETLECLDATSAGGSALSGDDLAELRRRTPAVANILERRSNRESYDRSKTIPRADLETIVRCGLMAPSSKHAKPWRLHVVEEVSVLDEIAEQARNSPGSDSYVPKHVWTLEAQLERWGSSVEESTRVLEKVPTAIFVENTGPFFGGRSGLMEAIADRETDVLDALAELIDDITDVSEKALRQRVVDLIATFRSTVVGYSFEMIGIGAAVENMFLAANALGIQCCFMGDLVIAEEHVKERLGIGGDFAGVLALGYSVEDVPVRGHLLDVYDPDHVEWHADAAT